MANTSLTTQLNTSPFYDDFDESKDFHRILFKPSMAVQARELTQLQTILQKQVDRFAEHIFEEGSLVSGGQFIFDKNFYYAKLNDADDLSTVININDYLGKTITGATTGVKATITYVQNGSQANALKKTIFYKIIQSGNNGTFKNFAPNELLITDDSFRAVVFNANDAVGKPSIFKIEAGVVFAKDHFIRFSEQSIILSEYTDTPTCKVGFELTESIVEYTDDATLLDPAQGSYNYAAPGADRLKITATLTKNALNATAKDNFVELFEVSSGIMQRRYEKPQYSIIRDELARRTDDESGDYYVRGLNVTVREHLNNGTNGGLFYANSGGNSSLLSIGIDPGKAYVKGYDFETLVTNYVSTLKGLDFLDVEQQVVSTNYANYIIVDELVGHFPVNEGAILTFYDVAQDRVSLNRFSAHAQTGDIVGTAKIKAITLLSGTQGTATAQYAIYLYDIDITSVTDSFADIRSVYINNASNADGGADIVLDGGIAKLYDPQFNWGVYEIGTKSARRLRDSSGNIDTTYTFIKSFDVSIASGGTFTVNTGLADEIFAYSVGALNTAQKNDFILTVNANSTVNMSGTVSVTSGSPTVSGSGTAFTRLNVGDHIEIQDVAGVYTILSITSDTLMTLTTNVVATGSTKTYSKKYYAGDIISFNSKGADAGTTRTVTVNSSTSTTFDIKETLTGTLSATITAKLNKVDAREIAKILRPDRYVLIDCSTAGTTGPFNLGIPDVYRIKEIRTKTSAFASTTEGTVVTSNFILDNGQRDTHYDHASIIPNGITLTSSTRILVKLDYFQPDFSQGAGYFSIDSYPIDDGVGSSTTIRTENIPIYVSTTTGRSFNLRNVVDTRPVKTQTANNVTSLTGITTNPSPTETFQSSVGGLKTPYPSEQFLIDYSYYLPRNDLVVADKNGGFRIIRGVSSIPPITPSVPSDAMSLALLRIAPFPSLSSTYASSVKRLDLANSVEKSAHKRYTMRDIGVLDKRISNLEYYQALSLLEKQAIDMKIPDENGLDRFKNGIFVDPFNDHTLGNLQDPDYKIAVDPIEKSIRPFFKSDAIKALVKSASSVSIRRNLVTLPYTEVAYSAQRGATGTRNAAGFFWNFKGKMELDPATDYWADTETTPSIQVTVGPSAAAWQALADATGTVWNDWQTTWTGVTSTNNGSTITTTTTSEQQRTRQVTDVITTTQTENLGNRVIDVGVIPYIRARQVKFSAWGLQPNARVYPFFDGEDVSAYCQLTDSSYTTQRAVGDPLRVDVDGNIYGIFNLPNSEEMRFRVGDRIFKLTDSSTNGDDSITVATAMYSSTGLVQQKQSTFLSTINPTFDVRNDTQVRTDVRISVTPVYIPPPASDPPTTSPPVNLDVGFTLPVIDPIVRTFEPLLPTLPPEERTPIIVPDPPVPDPPIPQIPEDPPVFRWDGGGDGGGGEPIAQTFFVSVPTGITHMFVSSVDLYFQTKSETLGATLELREVDSTGYITSKILPYSVVYVASDDVNVSDDSSVATRFTFDCPVCLADGQQYAFILTPEQNNPDYRVYTARLGENDLITGNRITSQPHSGIFFVSANASTWSPIHDEDMKFVINRANFDVSSVGSISLQNQPREYLIGTTYSGLWKQTSELVHGETRVELENITGGTIVVGDKIVQGSNSWSITNITGSVYRIKGEGVMSLIDDSITINTSGNVPRGITADIVGVVTPKGYLYSSYTKDGNFTVVLDQTSIDFVVGEEIRGFTSNNTLTIASFGMQKYSVIDFESSTLSFPSTSIDWSVRCVSEAGVMDSAFQKVTVGDNTIFNVMKAVHSATLERTTINVNSITHQCYLRTVNSYVSPVIDINRTFDIIVENIVNSDTTGETGKVGGNLWNKYISQKITLDAGNDAEDLKIFITGYKPPTSDIKVYVKLLNNEDRETFEVKNWIEMTPKTTNVFSSEQDSNDFKDFEYNIPDSMKTGSLGEIQYTNSVGTTFTGYRYYMIKIGLSSTNAALPPRATDLRAIALQI